MVAGTLADAGCTRDAVAEPARGVAGTIARVPGAAARVADWAVGGAEGLRIAADGAAFRGVWAKADVLHQVPRANAHSRA